MFDTFKKIIYKLKDKSFIFLIFIIPKINRQKLIEIARENNSLEIVEDEYESYIKEPLHELTKKRFRNHIGQKKIECFFGAVIKNVRLIGPFGLPFTRRGQIILETTTLNSFSSNLKSTIKLLGIIGFFREYFLAIFPFLEKRGHSLKWGAHLICRTLSVVKKDNGLSISTNFGHWMLEKLPQIRAIEAMIKKNDVTNCKVILNEAPANWQLESLKMMNIDTRNIHCLKGNSLKVDNLIISSLRNTGTKSYEFDPKARQWTAKRLRSNYNQMNTKTSSNDNISLFRQETPSRKIINIETLRNTLGLFNFFELKNLSEQSLYNSSIKFLYAKKFIYTYGSGASRMLFAKDLETCIEIFSVDQDDRFGSFYFASEMGVEYKCLPAGKLPLSLINDNAWSDFYELKDKNYWVVHTDELKLLIE